MTSVGLVGINECNPDGRLHVYNNCCTDHGLMVEHEVTTCSGEYGLYVYSNSAQSNAPLVYILNDNAGSGQQAAFKIRTDAATNVPFIIDNTHSVSPNAVSLQFTGGSPDNNVNYFIKANDTGAARMYVYSDGDLQNHDNSYGGISDERLKQDIVDASSQWDDIKNMRIRKYRFISDVEASGDEATTHLGVIAQELMDVSPGLVQHHNGLEPQPGVPEEEGELRDEYSVQYSVLYMKAVGALQEAQTRIETLETQVAALQN
jgi:hypothetical protein